MSMNCFFVTQASRKIGLGHITRCLSLANKLRRHAPGIKTSFIVETNFRKDIFVPASYFFVKTRKLSSRWLRRYIKRNKLKTDFVVVDFRNYRRDILQALKRLTCMVVCINDGIGKVPGSDLTFSPRFSRKSTHQKARKGYYEGSRFIILRDQFNRKRKLGIREKARKNIFVCFGGSDPNRITERAVNVLKERKLNGVRRVVIVAGTGKNLKSLKDQPGVSRKFVIKKGVRDIYSLMRRCRFSIVSGGTMMYEACFSGCPPIVISQNKEQDDEARCVESAGAAIRMGCYGKVNAQSLRLAVERLATDDTTIKGLRIRGTKVIDSKGSSRIATILLKAVGGGT